MSMKGGTALYRILLPIARPLNSIGQTLERIGRSMVERSETKYGTISAFYPEKSFIDLEHPTSSLPQNHIQINSLFPNALSHLASHNHGTIMVDHGTTTVDHGTAVMKSDDSKVEESLSKIFVTPNAKIGSNVTLGEFASVWFGVSLQDGVKIGSNSFVLDNSQIGENAIVGDNVAVMSNVVIGKNAKIEDGVVIRSGCKIGDNVTIKKGSIVKDGAVVDNSSKAELESVSSEKVGLICDGVRSIAFDERFGEKREVERPFAIELEYKYFQEDCDLTLSELEAVLEEGEAHEYKKLGKFGDIKGIEGVDEPPRRGLLFN